ncbi:ATP-binding cassette domain-containing protein [Synechococcus sp. CS-602]|uniref:ABC transporter ATP-binding protein n=1 Tax=Synechococcaceae TaxID=1890426 RepID=UPI0009F85FF7|nr:MULTISPECIES: ATP-binding cassette domain-containing protein [Synechococcaceae]MCT4364989.1 ATP-binding cassette domain-containing protein [Candidatus Regnicoccus frigidus MAG-AL1]MCT0202958.1 ATP-binding cassette domain-containing protein [Synechococcus sp. CS-603]MCT0205811.1 ATP-binding cassette domain-containing protein [Synechococcus sp. CS-602]MCT0245217.1 ATP-binding cassette domain-containing protein [Synechococcus sp. CS-601]MCT4367216.1 ATP-binding cassette domain-containing prote
MDRPLLLRAEQLKRQLGDRLLWSQLDLELRAGERLGLVAPSGAGKTLLLRALALLDPLQAGTIHLQGRPPASWGLPRWRSLVLYLTQRPVAHGGTVEANLRSPWSFQERRGRGGWRRERITDWLAALGRDPSFLAYDAERLSGGELQLLALLRALQLDPIVLLLDEPTASLDGATTGAVEALLIAWLGAGPRAAVFTSHDSEQIQRFASRTLELAR